MVHRFGDFERVAIFTALALAASAGARAATLSVEPDVVPLRGSIVFHVTTDHTLQPGGGYGPESPSRIYFNGACTNSISFSPTYSGPLGAAFDVPFPGGWSNPNLVCATLSQPGQYLATLEYTLSGTPGYQHIDVPFTVLAPLVVQAVPESIATGDTTLIGASGVNSGDPATGLQVECPGGAVDHAVDVTAIDAGFMIAWPGPFFEGACDSSQPGGYGVTLTTERRSATTSFRVYGDRDRDGWLDGDDNCPNHRNPAQEDGDGDNRGDACDTDGDNDGIHDDDDNCPDDANASQDDLDVDGLGDACDPDIEDDGDLNAADNCPRHFNPGQENADGDAFGDPCDPDPDDSDNDGVNDLVDNCWNVFNPAQQDDDGDGLGSACDPDIDGDGISNANEVLAGTHPNDPQPLEAGINPFWEGGAIGSGASVPDGEPIGVVVNPGPDVESIDVTVSDPWGGAYSHQTLIPQSPVAFTFVPVWPGAWTIEAEMDDGEVATATIHVIPEPFAALSGLAACAALFALRRR